MQNFSAKELERMSQGLPPWETMSFACGGWLQFYLFGVGKALQDCKLDKGVKYAGCSAGSLAAVGLTLEGDFDLAIKYCNETCLPLAYERYTGLFRLSEYVTGCLKSHLIQKFDEKKLENGALQVAVTRLPFLTAERVTVHESKEDLIDTLLASCAAFPFALMVRRKGKWYIDGGLSDFQPIMDENTVTVSPFYFSNCDIKPSRYIPLWWALVPPKDADTVQWIYNLGYDDCLEYIRSRGIPLTVKPKSSSGYINSSSHPYDTPKVVSMHRFLGYDVNKITNNSITFIMDLFLLVLLVLLWKPLALCLIYLELWVKIIVLSVTYSLKAAFTRSMKFARKVDRTVNRYASEKFESNKQWLREQHDDLWDCIRCAYSLSLFLRFVSGRPSSVELRKHDQLARISVLYRVFRHII